MCCEIAEPQGEKERTRRSMWCHISSAPIEEGEGSVDGESRRTARRIDDQKRVREKLTNSGSEPAKRTRGREIFDLIDRGGAGGARQ